MPTYREGISGRVLERRLMILIVDIVKVLTDVDTLGRAVPVMSKYLSLRGMEAGKETSYSRYSIDSTPSKKEHTFAFPSSTSNGPGWIGSWGAVYGTIPSSSVGSWVDCKGRCVCNWDGSCEQETGMFVRGSMLVVPASDQQIWPTLAYSAWIRWGAWQGWSSFLQGWSSFHHDRMRNDSYWWGDNGIYTYF